VSSECKGLLVLLCACCSEWSVAMTCMIYVSTKYRDLLLLPCARCSEWSTAMTCMIYVSTKYSVVIAAVCLLFRMVRCHSRCWRSS